ncbi:MAG: pyridine nucleotide-disulfide oxidoreductase [Thermoprotei archaeon]|nr:MAG: pyridine nucleotide-disulfide oxidoreductase [Thermoprotei archaeon]
MVVSALGGERIVIIGYGTAGITAAGYARRVGRRAEITVVEARDYAIYHPCAIPDAVAGHLSWESLVEEVSEAPRFKLLLGHKAEEVDSDAKTVRVRNLKTGEVTTLEYDKLIIATGSSPIVPRRIPGIDLDGIYPVKVVEDGVRIAKASERHKRVVVVGASAIGIEMAVALKSRGLDVTLVELKPQCMPGKLDRDMARLVEEELRRRGVNLILGSGVEAFEGKERVERVIAGGESIETDFVVLAMGVRPNVELAKQAGAELGELGAVKVNSRMETSVPDVYAAGDCVESVNLVTGKPTLAQFASVAFHHGRVAGINAAGGSAELKGVVVSWIVATEWLKFGAVGLTHDMAKAEGFDPISATVRTCAWACIYPEPVSAVIKLTADRESHRLLGAQIFSYGNVAYMLDVLSLAVSKSMKVEDLLDLETAYAPSVSTVPDALYVAIDALARRLRLV